ncbi:hypothetical protein GCM10007972_07390 [Iodidimonas muriae]|uniref:Uncharacterized protein n=1 Tax=Iodidimonas muriae TaxID=261467 RepID=A0ABQ2L9K5_9PROT|nr:hypothetical protein [Iodidimonas muriae]GER05989.1 hypothetical protein JCM17843_02990 [Kordiimonadales bacterium JCM 17843]GGO07732.1 hypothetical protein GCM10007972_07390 [Iodidimonas muriae]
MSADDLNDIFEQYPTLAPLSRFCRLIGQTPWFRHVGDPISDDLRLDGQLYAAALGFPEAEPAVLALWEDAAGAAESADFNSPAWEAEEQLRMALVHEALQQVDDNALDVALTHVAAVAADAANRGAEDVRGFLLIDDEAFVRAATGAAVQMCHQAALVIASGGEGEHVFSHKFQIFEQGRWPIGIIGSTLNIF